MKHSNAVAQKKWFAVCTIFTMCVLSGCVGITVQMQKTKHVYGSDDVPMMLPATSQELVQKQGQPVVVRSSESGQEYVYHAGYDWRGVAVWLLLPVPLMLPVGNLESVYIYSGEDRLVGGSYETNVEKNYGTIEAIVSTY